MDNSVNLTQDVSFETIKEQYLSVKKTRQILGVTTVTLRNWNKTNKIRAIRTPSGVRLYNKQDIQDIINLRESTCKKQKIVYCRVSSTKQKDDLDRQIYFFKQQYPNHTLVTDVGSGINWKRKGFTSILELAMQGQLSEVVVAHRDRLCRFAFELVQWILETNKVKLIVLNESNGESTNSELAEDILSIVHIYSCRQMGKRRYSESKKNKTVS